MRPDFLFAMPSWISGSARSLDLAGQFDEYNESASTQEADAKAIFVDWRIVGETIFDAIKAISLAPQESDRRKAG